jgi:acetyl-CoA acyltransferase 1
MARNHLLVQSPEDVVICCAVRTALTRYKKGGFKDALPEDLLTAVFKAVREYCGDARDRAPRQ